MAGIAADPDNPELDEEFWADAKPTHEIYPDGIDKPPYIPKEWRERLSREYRQYTSNTKEGKVCTPLELTISPCPLPTPSG